MRPRIRVLVTILAILGSVPAALAQGADPSESIEAFFDRFVALGRAYDLALAGLYADDAFIQSVRRYPDGTARTLQLVGAEYKRLIRTAMPLARQRGDRDRYSDVTVSTEGERMRIRSSRYNELKRYASPYELVVERTGTSWQIVEECSESQP